MRRMKRVTSGTWYRGNHAMPHPTYSIFSDSPCISFDSPACLPVQLFRRSHSQTQLLLRVLRDINHASHHH